MSNVILKNIDTVISQYLMKSGNDFQLKIKFGYMSHKSNSLKRMKYLRAAQLHRLIRNNQYTEQNLFTIKTLINGL
jgi:hypothetical protein